MSKSRSLSADQIIAEVAALAEHLQRSGVQFVPASDPRAVESLSASLAASTPAPSTTSGSAPPVTDISPSVSGNSPSVAGNSPSVAGAGPAAAGAAPSAAATTGPPSATTTPARSAAPIAPVDAMLEEYRGASLPVEQRHRDLEALAGQVAACVRCDALASCRTRTVFGEGSPTPRFAFFGEGPGVEEDRSGRPFVGKAGQLLTKMIEACTLRREEVYILNTVKCRPPNNRNPEPEEIEHCREYFEHQLSILRPEYIVCLGAVSSRALLHSKLSVGRLRGRLHRYFESKVLVTYHPAYLLRTPAAKKAAWEDLQLMLRDAGIDPRASQ